MSGWRIVTRELYDRGGRIDRTKFQARLNVTIALRAARRLGLVDHDPIERAGTRTHAWFLTPLGVAWAEGRIDFLEHRRDGWHGTRPVATWMAPLGETPEASALVRKTNATEGRCPWIF